MDVLAACRAFVAVSRHGNFTVGAAAIGIPQSVASRRIAALERHYGSRLLERTSRSATLTAVGKVMLPSARRLVELAETMEQEAERAKLRPFRVAVPTTSAPLPLAQLVADAHHHQLNLDLHLAGPSERAELGRTGEVRAAFVAVASDQGKWQVPLGLADTGGPHFGPIYLQTLRAARADQHSRRRRVWIQPEDDVPHIREHLTRMRDALGLQPTQVAVGTSLVAAVAEVLGTNDLLLCAQSQAVDLGLHWRPIGELELSRGYALAAAQLEDAERIGSLSSAAIARCLGQLS
ncbi:LysR family transcriptional regulator [Nocardia brasiliensis]|uniref:LysR family transcriptional regulator n=1 Tax=Nocardia brasiliensis TaxID=37326 RepID=A0A6G9XTX4_NOCBR|nr:LysR family transcriptional regulator [Nocardia brasiliensis]QIS04355.1 LysR family transcriptional regulator [Nocardia brasiliensis]